MRPYLYYYMHTHQTVARMAEDPAVSSIEFDCLQRYDLSLSQAYSPGDHSSTPDEAVARRLTVYHGAPWGIDRIDTKGKPL
jgi:hypothetical protein